MMTRSATPRIAAMFVAILIAALLSSCALIKKSAPALETALTPEAQISVWCDVDAMPLDWEKAKALWATYAPKLREKYGDDLISTLEQSGLKPEDFSKFVTDIDSFDFTSEADIYSTFNDTSWMLGVDIHGFLPADLIEFGINAKSEKSGLVAKRNGNWKQFDRIDIHEANNDRFLLSIAVFTAKTTQIRLGQPGKLERSIVSPSNGSSLDPKKLITANQAWIHVDVPEALMDEIRQIETALPIDTGALLSGFNGITTSFQLTDYALNSLLTFEFDQRESADTAFSILNLSTSFILKPALKRTVGDAKHFISSIHAERNGEWVQYRFSVDQSDTNALRSYVGNVEGSALLSYALDLINSH